MDFLHKHPADQLTAIMSRVYESKLTTASGGNVSIRDENGDVWITPKATDKGEMTTEQIVRVRPDGSYEGAYAPSSELPFHMAAYRARPDIRAVLHAHSDYCVAFSLTRTLPRADLVPATARLCQKTSLSAYAMTGSEELAANIGGEFQKGSDVVYMENHGVCVGGGDLLEAFGRFEASEYAGRLEATARRLGTPRALMLRQTERFCRAPSYEPFDAPKPGAEETSARRAIAAMARRAYAKGLFFAALGTASIRLPDGSVLVTPENLDRALLEESDLVLLRGGAAERGKTPARDAELHARIYARNPAVHAVLSAQPPCAAAFAASDAKLDTYTIPESYYQLRDVPGASFSQMYEHPAEGAALFSPRVPVVLFENGGVVTTGESLFQAFDRLEVAEATARSVVNARGIGEIVLLTAGEIGAIREKFNLD